MATDIDHVDFFLDPGCPWTWVTSRWLADVAEQRGLDVRWRPFSLALLNAGKPRPPQFDTPEMRARIATAGRALDIVAALSAAGDHALAGRFYAAFGRRFHQGEDPSPDPVQAAADEVGVSAAVVEDAGSEEVRQVVASDLALAMELAGPDIGSPVLRIDDQARGVHGPILSRPITGPDAARVFDAIATLHGEDRFFEVKRGRTGPPSTSAD